MSTDVPTCFLSKTLPNYLFKPKTFRVYREDGYEWESRPESKGTGILNLRERNHIEALCVRAFHREYKKYPRRVMWVGSEQRYRELVNDGRSNSFIDLLDLVFNDDAPTIQRFVFAVGVIHKQDIVICDRVAYLQVDDRDELHSTDGPAVVWSDGTCEYWLRGVPVKDRWIRHPKRIAIKEVRDETNAEVKSRLTELYIEHNGHEQFIEKMRATLLDQTKRGKLWGVKDGTEERRGLQYSYTMAEVVNSSPEPDGTYKTYYLTTPPEMRDADEAVAWTFFMTKKEYRLAMET